MALTKDRLDVLFKSNQMKSLTTLDVPMTLSGIKAAEALLESLPLTLKYIGDLTVKVAIPESNQGESIGDMVALLLSQMVGFKLNCKRREAEHRCKVTWRWKQDGILSILLQQQMLGSVNELIDP